MNQTNFYIDLAILISYSYLKKLKLNNFIYRSVALVSIKKIIHVRLERTNFRPNLRNDIKNQQKILNLPEN